MISRRVVYAILAVLAGLMAQPAAAQSYPLKPITIIVPGAPGNGADIYARHVASSLSAILKQSVIVENKPGANNIIAIMAAKQAPADGHTILVSTATAAALNPVIVKKLPYDPADFRWVSGLAEGAAVIVVSADSPYHSLSDLIAAAKANPKGLSYGAYATPYRMGSEWLNQQTDVEITHIPYSGASQLATDLVGGLLAYAMMDISAARPFLQSGRMRALAITSPQRHPSYPDIPTAIENGLPGFVHTAWLALAVRAETPDSEVKILAKAMEQVLASKEAQDFAATQGTPLLVYGPEEMTKLAQDEFVRYKQIAERANIQAE